MSAGWHWQAGAAALLALMSICGGWALAGETVTLFAGMHRIEAEIAATPEQREMGLMYRETMPMQQGMLFVFPNLARHCMWMKHTPLALSVAFLDDTGRIINIEDMPPLTEKSHCATRAARYALEMNQGWFQLRGLVPGSALTGIDSAPVGQ